MGFVVVLPILRDGAAKGICFFPTTKAGVPHQEAFLAAKLGEPYLAYCARVPRLLPALMPRVAASQTRAAWGTAFLGESYLWGVAIAFLAVGYRYNAFLITQGVIISLGVSLVARALIPKSAVEQDGVTFLRG